jgi:hypothetical protein
MPADKSPSIVTYAHRYKRLNSCARTTEPDADPETRSTWSP